MKALYDNLKAWGRPLFATLHQIGASKTATNSVQKVLYRRHTNPVAINNARKSDDKKLWWIELGTSFANVGDVIRLTGYGLECDVVEVDDDTGEVAIRATIQANLQPGITEVIVLAYTTPEVDGLSNAVKVALQNATVRFVKDGTDVLVTEDSANPFASVGLPVSEIQKKVREHGYIDYSVDAVSDAAETSVIGATAATTKRISVAETGGKPMYLMINGSADILVPRGGIEVDHFIPAGTSIGVKSLSGDITEGDLIINLIG